MTAIILQRDRRKSMNLYLSLQDFLCIFLNERITHLFKSLYFIHFLQNLKLLLFLSNLPHGYLVSLFFQ